MFFCLWSALSRSVSNPTSGQQFSLPWCRVSPLFMQVRSSWHMQSGSRGTQGRGWIAAVSCGGSQLLSGHPEHFPWGWTLVTFWNIFLPIECTGRGQRGRKDDSQQISCVHLLMSVLSFLPSFVLDRITEPLTPALQGWAKLFFDLCIMKRCISSRDSRCRTCVCAACLVQMLFP